MTLVLLLASSLSALGEDHRHAHGKLTPWDVEGMYARAWTILEDKTIQNVAGVPAMLEACARADFVPAQHLLLDVYEGRFKGLEAKPDQAIRLALSIASAPPQAEESEARRQMRYEAMYRCATYCERGYGVEKNPAEAYRWMRKAAEGGLSKARVELARYLINGIGHAPAPRMALLLLREQVAQAPETPNLFFYLGYMCSRGIGLRRPNHLMALRFYERGAALQDARATNNLAAMYERGIIVSQDGATALRLYKKAAALGNKDASSNVQRLAFKTDREAGSDTPPKERIHRACRRVIQALPLSEESRSFLQNALPLPEGSSTGAES